MCRKVFISTLVVFAALITIVAGYKMLSKPQLIEKDINTITLEGKVRTFSEIGIDNFTSTGLAFDEKDHSFWICDYGALNSNVTPSPRVIEINKDLSEVLNVLDLSNILSDGENLQAVAWDQENDSLWLAVGDSCKNIKKDGTLIFEFDLGKYKKYKSNGICVDGNTLWVLCYSKYLLHYNKNGKVLDEYRFNFKDQDMIFNNKDELLVTVGADYNGESNYVVSFDKATGKISVKYQTIGAYAIEGITVVDDKMYIVNDGLYHNAKIKESYFSIYDLKQKTITCPQQCH